ncbi:MAG: hypothetical protein Kow006_04390 [Gammaproteobacteria bacterium]
MNSVSAGEARERLLDVSGLEPCEPLERALEALRQLQPGEYLHMIHRQEPLLLYPMLERLGMRWHTRVGELVEVYVYPENDAVAKQAVLAIANAAG